MSARPRAALIGAIALSMTVASLSGVLLAGIALQSVEAMRNGDLLDAVVIMGIWVTLVIVLAGLILAQRNEITFTED